MAVYARKTDRLEGALALIGFAFGGEAGARLAGELGLGGDDVRVLAWTTGLSGVVAATAPS